MYAEKNSYTLTLSLIEDLLHRNQVNIDLFNEERKEHYRAIHDIDKEILKLTEDRVNLLKELGRVS